MAKKAVYKNNTLAWVVWNAKNQWDESTSEIRNDWNNVVKPELADIWTNIYNAEKDVFVDRPLNMASTVASFIAWDPVLAQEWKNVPTVNTWIQLKSLNTKNTAPVQNTNSNQWTTAWVNQWIATWWATTATQWATQWNNWTTSWWKMNANLNFNDYWDDSSPENQSTPWGLREKNTWEWVATSNIAYNPNADINNLWDYKYWEEGRQENAKSAGYLARRNDEIASALYNAWLVEKADIIQYLANQPWWNNSTEADRVNTVEAIWKRIWQMAPKEENKEVDYSRLDNIRTEDTSWTLYWKTTADEWNPEEGIPALSDANNVFKSMEESVISEVRGLLNMSTDTIATAVWDWISLCSETAMREYQTQYPELWAEVQQKVKQLQWWQNVNAIASWWEMVTTADKNNWTNTTVDYAINNSWLSVSATELLKSIDEKLAMDNNASTAEQTMDLIADEMQKQKNKLMNLKKEANNVFKWDAPDYLVKAFMNNRSLEIQDNLSRLEARYNAALDRYKIAVSHAEWQADYELKKQSLALDVWKETNWATWNSWTTNKNYTVAERNNNPLNITVDWMKIMWWQLWVDYEVSSDSFVNSNWGRQYYAKLIWDPVETTIRLLDRAVANWMNPFTKNSWSYIEAIWMNKSKWTSMSYEDKAKYINDVWLPREWWKMENMAYYISKNSVNYNPASASLYDKYLSWDYWEWWLEKTAKAEWQTTTEFANSAKAYKADVEAWLFNPSWDWWVLSETAYNLLWMFAELYNLTANDNWQLDFSFWSFWTTYPYDKRDQIKAEMTLEKMVEARANEIWFWQVTEWEWAMLRNAATAMWSAWWTRDKNVNKEVNWLLSALWHAAYWKNENITPEKWKSFRQEIDNRTNWNSSLEAQMKDEAITWLSSWNWNWWVVIEPSDWNYVNAYWIID